MKAIFEKTRPYLDSKIWGGNLLESLKGSSISHIGESFEVSNIEGKECKVAGKKLSELAEGPQLPYLVKIIDTAENLSVQAHPDDEYARKHEKSSGKTECWLILDSRPGSGIYLGFKKGTSREAFISAIEEKNEVASFLNFYPVKKGDFFYVPAGSIHAIGRGVTLLEVQQRSGITYRVWDWNRVDQQGNSRELHTKKALDILNFEASKNRQEFFCIQNNLLQKNGRELLVEHPDFSFEVISEVESFQFEAGKERVTGIICLAGSLKLKSEGRELNLSKFESAIIFNGKIGVIGDGFCSFALIT